MQSLRELLKGMVEVIQAKAATVPDFNNGAIRILMVPKNPFAEEWLGGFSLPGSPCEIDFGYVIKKGGSHVRPAGWRGNPEKGEVDTYGYAALKVEAAAYVVKNGLGYRSADLPADAVIPGRKASQGCVVFEVSSKLSGYSTGLVLRVYVAVSGGTGEEDELCAMAVESVLDGWCDRSSKGLVEYYISGRP